MSILSAYIDPPSLGVEESKGNQGLSYRIIYSKIGTILRSENPVRLPHEKAARLLYVSNGIRIENNLFARTSIANLDCLVVHQDMGPDYDRYPFDVAQLDNVDIVFIYRNCLVDENIPLSVRFANLYQLYNAFASMFIKSSLSVCYSSIYCTINRYAAYVMTVKTLVGMGEQITMDIIDYDMLPEGDNNFINQETLEVVKELSEEDLLSYGALCEYCQ